MPSDLELYTVQVTDTILTAMKKITANRHRVVVVLEGKKVVGTVSDGDIRRAFLKEVLPISPVEKIMNINCRMTTERESSRWADAIQKEQVTVLPVVNRHNELVDVALGLEPFREPDARPRMPGN